MFEHIGITKSDVDILFNIVLTGTNVYWMIKFNSVKVKDQVLRTMKDQNEEQEREIKNLRHRVLVLGIKKRREHGTSRPTLA